MNTFNLCKEKWTVDQHFVKNYSKNITFKENVFAVSYLLICLKEWNKVNRLSTSAPSVKISSTELLNCLQILISLKKKLKIIYSSLKF